MRAEVPVQTTLGVGRWPTAERVFQCAHLLHLHFFENVTVNALRGSRCIALDLIIVTSNSLLNVSFGRTFTVDCKYLPT